MKPTERGKIVWQLADLLEKHADELAEIESLDNGKPVSDAKAVDLPFACELLRYMARLGDQDHRPDAFRSPRPATGTPIRCASRSAWSARSSRGTSRC